MNAYEIKEAVMSADLNDSKQVGELLVTIADKLVDLEYQLNRLRRRQDNEDVDNDNTGGPYAIPRHW